MSAEIVDNPDRSRYEARVDGAVAAYLEYDRHEHFTAFPHTEVNRAYRGQGLGSMLVRQALDDVRESGDKAYPLCPYVKSWLGKHPEYDDVLYRS
jgi:predicted GNAT family acetyltransferase